MFSQSLFAQLIRMSLLLIFTLYFVHHYQPLIDALAKNAVNAGCHQHSPYQDNKQQSLTAHSVHHHMEHH